MTDDLVSEIPFIRRKGYTETEESGPSTSIWGQRVFDSHWICVLCPHGFQEGMKLLPVHNFLNLRQRVTAIVQLFKTQLPIQQASLHHVYSLYVDFDARP